MNQLTLLMPYRKNILLVSWLFSLLSATGVFAHEYYLLPRNFSPASPSIVEIEHRLGQKFKGNQLPWVNRWNVRSELWGDGQPLKGKDGDQPALSFETNNQMLFAVIHQSNLESLTFKTWEKFRKYVTKEGLGHIATQHQIEATSLSPVKEVYSRFAKTLITPNQTQKGLDRETGLTIEMIAKANPNALEPNQPMPVQLLYRGSPLAGAMIKVFVGIDTTVAFRILTNKEGIALIPGRGIGPYLLNAIHMTKPQSKDPLATGANWESYWASLTYRRRQ